MQNDTTYGSLATLVSDYIRDKRQDTITEIARTLADIYRAQKVILWRYDSSHNTIASLCDPNDSIRLEKSLTYKAVRTQKPLLCTHVTSDPFYAKTIDNPYDLPLRNLLFYPVCDRNDTIVGIVVLCRTTHQRRIFTLTHIRQLDEIKPLLQALWLPERQASEEIEAFLAKLDSDTQKRVPDTSSDTHAETESKTIEHNKGKIDELQTHIDTLQTALKTEQKRTEDLKQENRRLRMIVDELTHELKALQIDYNSTQKEINLLRSRLEQSKQVALDTLPSTAQNEPCAATVLFENYAQTIAPYPVLWTLSEYMLHAVDLEQHDVLRRIEAQLNQAFTFRDLDAITKLTPLLTKREKRYDPKQIASFVETFGGFDTSGCVNVVVACDESLPPLLSFDLPKVYEALLHIFYDLSKLCDDRHEVAFHLSYQVNETQTKKALLMRFSGVSQDQKTTRFLFFNKKTNSNDRTDRMHFNIAKQIVSAIQGSLRAEHNDKEIWYELALPVRILA